MHSPDLELATAWQRHLGDAPRLFDGVVTRHREKHRRYHSVTHVAWVIRHVEELAGAVPVTHLDEVVAAAFYHDAIYEPTHPANERASARLARRDLTELGWEDGCIDRVCAMIEATAHLADAPAPGEASSAAGNTGSDTAVLLDADLAVLGADPAAYSAYVAGVRGEYHHLDDEAWRAGRTAVVEHFLARDAIFTTPPARDWWESRARANLTAELATLT